MPRRKIDVHNVGPFHICNRCINKEWFSIPMDSVWRIFTDHLRFCSFAYEVKIHAFVLMSNHFHLLASTPELNLPDFAEYAFREISRDLNRDGNRINKTFAGRYRASHLTNFGHFLNSYKYVYQNPVRAGICSKIEDYKYSTAHGLLGFESLPLVVHDDFLLDGDLQQNLKWLNTLPKQEHVEDMRKALRRGTFKLPRVGNKEHPLESERL